MPSENPPSAPPSPAPPSAIGKSFVESLFKECRTPACFAETAIEQEILRQLYALVKWGPTSGNCQPARFVFLTGESQKERLRPALSIGNVTRAMAAPVLALCAYDPLFFENLPRLSKIRGLREWFAADMGLSEETAFRNATLQDGYFILAARSLGLACLPMSGFDGPMVEDMFLKEEGWRINFLVALGYPDQDKPEKEREPRLEFEEACRIL